MHQKFNFQQFKDSSVSKLELLETFMNSQVLESVILVAQIENLDSARQRAAQYSHSQMLYNLQLKDGANYIKAHASISIIPKCIQDGMIVEVICQYKPIISKKNDCLEIEANILKIKQLEYPEKHYIDHTALMLQNLKPNRVIFPEHEIPKVTLLYSNASQALVNKDFLDALDYQKNYIILDTKTVNLSDVKSLSQTINDIKTDILIIIRGGGDPQTLTAFDHLDVLNAFSKQPAYKIVGIGHASNNNLINLFADYSATTPTDAGYFLKKKLYQKYSKQKEIRILNKNIQNLEEQLGYKKEFNSNLNHSLVKISNHFDASNQKLHQQLKDNQKFLLNFEQSLITIQRNMSTLDSSHKKYNMLIGAMLLIIVLLSGVIIKINL